MNEFRENIKKLGKRRFYKYGLPFLVLIVAGSVGLKEFASLRYTFRRSQMLTPKEAEALGIKLKRPEEVTLESEYEKMKKMDIDNWENIRGPRPWEENISK